MIDELTLKEITGQYYTYVSNNLNSKEISHEEIANFFEAAKSRIKSFATYQLTNSLVDSGVGCGYYDEEGNEDKHNISVQLNDYLFNVCFASTEDNDGYTFFIDYLMLNYPDFFAFDGEQGKRMPTLESFTKVLDRTKLNCYWLRNRDGILAKNYVESSRRVITTNYTLTYRDNMANIFNVLDQLKDESKK